MPAKSFYEKKHHITAAQVEQVVKDLMDDPDLDRKHQDGTPWYVNGPVTQRGTRYRLLNQYRYWVEDIGAMIVVTDRIKETIQRKVRKALDDKYGVEWKENHHV